MAAGLAGIAPNGLVMGSYGSSRGGRQYVTVHVQVCVPYRCVRACVCVCVCVCVWC